MSYSKQRILEVKSKIEEIVDYMISFKSGKIEINFNRDRGIIEIVPQPHIKMNVGDGVTNDIIET